MGVSSFQPVDTGTWQNYTPLFRFGTSADMTAGAMQARYCQIGKLVVGNVNIKYGTVSGTGDLNVTLPVTPKTPLSVPDTGWYIIGEGEWIRSGVAAGSILLAYDTNASRVRLLRTDQLTLAVGHNSPYTWTTNDHFNFTFQYEAA